LIGRCSTGSFAPRVISTSIRSLGGGTIACTTKSSSAPCRHSRAALSRRGMATGSTSTTSSSNTEFVTLAQPAPGSPFHYAFPVHDLEMAKEFYGNVLGCAEGRSSDRWQDFSLNGHQIVCHWVGNDYKCIDYYNPVDGDEVCAIDSYFSCHRATTTSGRFSMCDFSALHKFSLIPFYPTSKISGSCASCRVGSDGTGIS